MVDGVDTTTPLFDALLDEPDIQKGDYNIHWLEKWLAAGGVTVRDDAARDHARAAPAGLCLGRLSDGGARRTRTSSSGSIRGGAASCRSTGCTSRAGWRGASSRGDFEIRVDGDFAGVVAACAERQETWINDQIRRLYRELHRMGHAHSVEIRHEGALAGGLYGVALGGAFFGESMFSRRRDASKLALIALVARLRAGGFRLLDTQFVTPHLARLGAVEISRAAYHRELEAALARPANFLALAADASRQLLLQLSTQTS